jgi:hypothetical protein
MLNIFLVVSSETSVRQFLECAEELGLEEIGCSVRVARRADGSAFWHTRLQPM